MIFPQALFLDRDGTLIEWVDYLHKAEEVVLMPRVTEALGLAKEKGCRLFIHTNQSGVGRGYFPMKAVHAVNARMFELMNVDENFFDGICIAPEDPSSEESLYRKPQPKYELEMIEKFNLDPSRCYMIGDNPSDIQSGVNAGIQTVGIWNEENLQERHQKMKAAGAEISPSIYAFIQNILNED